MQTTLTNGTAHTTYLYYNNLGSIKAKELGGFVKAVGKAFLPGADLLACVANGCGYCSAPLYRRIINQIIYRINYPRQFQLTKLPAHHKLNQQSSPNTNHINSLNILLVKTFIDYVICLAGSLLPDCTKCLVTKNFSCAILFIYLLELV